MEQFGVAPRKLAELASRLNRVAPEASTMKKACRLPWPPQGAHGALGEGGGRDKQHDDAPH